MEAEHRVEAEFAGNDHRHGDGCLRKGIRKPAVKREDRHLYGEGEEEGEGHPEQCTGGKCPGGNLKAEFAEVEGSGAGVEIEDGNEKRGRGDEGEEEKFGCGGGAVLAAVHGNEDGHGDEREFPEAVVDHEVKRDEDT